MSSIAYAKRKNTTTITKTNFPETKDNIIPKI